MKDITYQITMHTDWHCGSGLAAGADVDALVVKDERGLPYVPGKTIKGLVREALEELNQIQKGKFLTNETFVNNFGFFLGEKDQMTKGTIFFENAELMPAEANAILKQDLAQYLFRSVSSTAIRTDGIAKEHSLRKMQVTVPCTLRGTIRFVEDSMYEPIVFALSYIKRLGQNRNRGLGRCTITVIKEGGAQ